MGTGIVAIGAAGEGPVRAASGGCEPTTRRVGALRRVAVAGGLVVGPGIVGAGGVARVASPTTVTDPSGWVVPVSSVVDPVVVEQAAVAAAAVAARQARMDVLVDPDDPALVAVLDTLYVAGGAARREIDARLASMAEQGLTVTANVEVPDMLTVEQVVLGGGPPWTAAEVTACVVESGTYHGAGPESSLLVVGDEVRAFRAVYVMVNQDGTWKVDTARFVADWPAETTCPPAPPTTTAVPTTLDARTLEEALVAQRVHEIQAVRLNAYNNLDAPGNAEALDASYTENGVARRVVESDLQAMRDTGWRVRPHPTLPNTLTIESITLGEGPPWTQAAVQVCIVDPAILYEPGAGPDGSDAIVNDDIITGRGVEHLLLENGTWQLDRVEGVDGVDEWRGVTECPAP